MALNLTSRRVTQSVAAQALALVPLVVGLIVGGVALPRAEAPAEIPLPTLDTRVLAAVIASDDERAARSATTRLPSPARAVGSALRAFNAAEAERADAVTMGHARDEVVRTVREAIDQGVEPLKDLRAFELHRFLAEVRAYEGTGVVSSELREVGGTFIDRMTMVGWCDHHRLAMPELVRRVAFKLTWNRATLLDRDPRFAVTLDETRALYAFYFSHPHASEEQHARYVSAMSAAPDALSCDRAQEAFAKAKAVWLFGKISELGRMDPTYPAGLAQGAALFLKHDYAGAAMLYETWLDAHPAGDWHLRAQNYLQAALRANESSLQ